MSDVDAPLHFRFVYI